MTASKRDELVSAWREAGRLAAEAQELREWAHWIGDAEAAAEQASQTGIVRALEQKLLTFGEPVD